MLQPLMDAYLTLSSLSTFTIGSRKLHPFQQVDFGFYVSSNRSLNSIIAQIEEKGFHVHRMSITDREGRFPKLPFSELGSICAPFFSELLGNLGGDRKWFCQTRGLKPPVVRTPVRASFDREGLLLKSEKDGRAVVIASRKVLTRLIRRSWQSPLIDVIFFLPKMDQVSSVASLLQQPYTSYNFIKLINCCESIVSKDNNGFSLSFLTKWDLTSLSEKCRLQEVEHRFRQYIEKGLKEFEDTVAPFWQEILHRAERFWKRVKAQRVPIQAFLDWSTEWARRGCLERWELLGARLQDDRLIRLLYELQFERATVWAFLDMEIPLGIIHSVQFDMIYFRACTGSKDLHSPHPQLT